MTFRKVTRDKAVRLKCMGLLPSTVHYLYVDTEKVSSSYVKPADGLLGDPLVSDADGRIELVYYHVTGSFDVSSRSQQSMVNASAVPKKRRFIVSSTNASTLSPSDEQTSRSSAVVSF